MKNIIFIILILIGNISFGQTETNANKSVVESFIDNYNKENYKAIFSMFSTEMQNSLPLDITTQFLTDIKSQAGLIRKQEFIKYENGTYASYKTEFEYAVLTLNISLDDKSKINGLLFNEYIDKESSIMPIDNQSEKRNVITKRQSETIFNKVNIFPNHTQLAFAFIKNGNVSFYGVKRENDTISSINNRKNIFEIGSITKVFTSTLLADFLVKKKIDINDYINDYLDIILNNNNKLSFKQLANHTSGLPPLPTNLDLATANPANPYKEYKEKDLKEYLTTSLELTPNSIGEYRYSNLGGGLLGYTLSKIEGLSYDSLIHNVIFSKYKMLNSTTNLNKVNNELVKGLDTEGNEVSNWEFSVLVGAGGILSNVEDLSKFAVAQFDTSNRALALTRDKTFEIDDERNIGLGWHILKSKSGNQWHWHNGGTGGYSSSMVIDVKNKSGIIILSNVSTFNPDRGNIDKLCFELMEALEKNN